MQQLEAQEARFAESLVALQFQKAARAARTLRAYTALLSVQDLLLEELSESETLTKAACAQILDSHSPVSAAGREADGAARHPSAHPGSPLPVGGLRCLPAGPGPWGGVSDGQDISTCPNPCSEMLEGSRGPEGGTQARATL